MRTSGIITNKNPTKIMNPVILLRNTALKTVLHADFYNFVCLNTITHTSKRKVSIRLIIALRLNNDQALGNK